MIYRDRRGRFTTRAKWLAAKRRARARAAKRRARARQREARRQELPAGTEFELTARYRKGGMAALHLTVRVILDTPMTSEQAQALTRRMFTDGMTPPGITAVGINWAQRGKSGENDNPDTTALRQIAAAILAAPVPRWARVKPEGEL